MPKPSSISSLLRPSPSAPHAFSKYFPFLAPLDPPMSSSLVGTPLFTVDHCSVAELEGNRATSLLPPFSCVIDDPGLFFRPFALHLPGIHETTTSPFLSGQTASGEPFFSSWIDSVNRYRSSETSFPLIPFGLLSNAAAASPFSQVSPNSPFG